MLKEKKIKLDQLLTPKPRINSKLVKGLKVKTETIQIVSGKSDTNHQQKKIHNKTKRRANIQHNRNKVGKIAVTPTQNPEAIKEKKNVTTTNSNFYRIKNQ